MIGYVVRVHEYIAPPIGIEVFNPTYVYIVISPSRISSNFTHVYKVEFKPMGELRKGLDGDAYFVTKVIYLELI